VGELNTSRGSVPTPVFMPVGSRAAVKTLTPDELRDLDVPIILANTYHLYLRPGIDAIESMGGLHKFMGWEGPILTDSGGYQIFSLASLRKITDEGVTFRSHIDGSEHFITPELAIDYQAALGSDIIMVLDECPGHNDKLDKVTEAMQRTGRWAERCRQHHSRSDQALYAIVQGGMSPELRRQSAEHLVSLDFPGYAIGGLSLGEAKSVTWSIVEVTVPLLPREKPRYLMGVGSPEDIVTAVGLGIDMFDSALPTRVARNGAVYTWQGRQNIRRSVHRREERPLVEGCACYTCRHFSAAYLHHLFDCGETLALRLATIHNLHFLQELIRQIRESILAGTFPDFRESFLATYQPANEQVRLEQKRKWLDSRR
jgi:queuine tRNA-ribosyltransferase